MTLSSARDLLVAIFATLSFAPCAFAQGAAPSAQEQREARRQELFETGLEAARQRNYQMAYRNFRDSEDAVYNADVRPESMYNLALAAAQLPQHELRAIAGFKAYLIAMPDAENASQMTREIRRLQVTFETRFITILDTMEASVPTWIYSDAPGSTSYGYINAYLFMGHPERGQRAMIRSHRTRANWIRSWSFSSSASAYASYARGRAAPEEMRSQAQFLDGQFEYAVEAGDLTAARAALDALANTSVYQWARLGCAARAAADESTRMLAVTRIAAFAFDTWDHRRGVVAMLAELDERDRALALVQQATLSPEEQGALRREIEQHRVCSDGWWSGRNRYAFLRDVALHGVTRYTMFRDEAFDDTNLLELIEARRSALSSRANMHSNTSSEYGPVMGAHNLISHYVERIAQAYRQVHGPFQ